MLCSSPLRNQSWPVFLIHGNRLDIVRNQIHKLVPSPHGFNASSTPLNHLADGAHACPHLRSSAIGRSTLLASRAADIGSKGQMVAISFPEDNDRFKLYSVAAELKRQGRHVQTVHVYTPFEEMLRSQPAELLKYLVLLALNYNGSPNKTESSLFQITQKNMKRALDLVSSVPGMNKEGLVVLEALLHPLGWKSHDTVWIELKYPYDLVVDSSSTSSTYSKLKSHLSNLPHYPSNVYKHPRLSKTVRFPIDYHETPEYIRNELAEIMRRYPTPMGGTNHYYVNQHDKWHKPDLTYSIKASDNIPDFYRVMGLTILLENSIENAFSSWQSIGPLNFSRVEANSDKTPDISLIYGRLTPHGRVISALSRTYNPQQNVTIVLEIADFTDIPFNKVLMMGIGHSLGIGNSGNSGVLMQPCVDGLTAKTQNIDEDAFCAMHDLYSSPFECPLKFTGQMLINLPKGSDSYELEQCRCDHLRNLTEAKDKCPV